MKVQELIVLPQLNPTWIRLFDGHVDGMVCSRDGKQIYLWVEQPVINVWNVVVHFLPEVSAGLVALVSLICCLLAWRVARRMRQPGRSYCRRCNYDLGDRRVGDKALGQARALCSECGKDLAHRRSVVKGRRLRWRLAPLVVSVAVLLGLYSWAGLGGLWVRGALDDAVHWPSRNLASWADRSGPRWLGSFERPGLCLVALDVETGSRRATLCTTVSMGVSGLRGSTDGSRLAWIEDQERVLSLDLTSDRVTSALLPKDIASQRSPRRGAAMPYLLVGFLPDSTDVLVAAEQGFIGWDAAQDGGAVVGPRRAINLATGVVIFEKEPPSVMTPAGVDPLSGTASWDVVDLSGKAEPWVRQVRAGATVAGNGELVLLPHRFGYLDDGPDIPPFAQTGFPIALPRPLPGCVERRG